MTTNNKEGAMAHEEWGEGPWNNEPDHEVWIDRVTDYDCMINRGPSGALCGYVGVGPDHPLHGVGYNDVDVAVHGGLTYADACQEGGDICHVPEPGREHDIWWFGFDCAHAFDLAPRIRYDMDQLRHLAETLIPLTPPPGYPQDVYRDWDYVKKETEDLAMQLKLLAS